MRAMNKPRTPFLLTAAIPVLLAALPACAQEEAGADDGDEAPVAETWDEKASYALGVNIGSNLDPEDLTLDADLVLRGFMDALEGTEAMESEEIDSVLGELSTKMQEHADRARKAAMMENTAKSAAFLAEKAREDGIVKTDSGLLYRELLPGEGDSPTANQTVTVHYRGALIDGTVFDSSYDRDQPDHLPRRRLHSRLVRSVAVDEARRQVGTLHSRRTRLRRERLAASHPARRRPHLRSRAPRSRVAPGLSPRRR